MKIENIKITDLILNKSNPRVNDEAAKKLIKGIEKYGFINPVIANKNKHVLAGHTRIKAMLEMGKDTVPVIFVDMDEATAKGFSIWDNKSAEFSEWDEELLKVEIQGLFDDDFDIELTGFELEDFDLDKKEGLTDEDEVPEPPEEPIVKLGDVWLLGNHRLMCGDSTKVTDVERLMDGEKAEIMFTSPPYNAGDNSLGGNKNMVSQKYVNDSDNKTQDEYLSFLSLSMECAKQYTQHQVYNIQQLSGNKIAFIDFLHTYKDYFVDVAIWNKGGGQPAMQESVMNSRFEYVLIFSKDEKPTRQIKTNKFRNMSNVFDLNPSGKNKNTEIHAAVFPVEFVAHFIGYLSSDSVLDLFGGSGSTLIACEQLNRKCYMMELDPKYCDVIIKRWEEYTGGKAELIGGES